MAVNFDDYMNVPMSEMKRVLLPDGHYFANIKKHDPKMSGKDKPMLNTSFALTSPGDDVPIDQLPENGVSNKVISMNSMLAEDFGRAAIGDMIRASGVPFDEAQGFGAVLPSTLNQPVKLLIGSRLSVKDDPTSERVNEVKKVLPAV